MNSSAKAPPQPSFLNRRPPVDVARDILTDRYPNALLAFVAGSFNRGEATMFSDIDLVVIFQKLDYAWRESFVFQEWPVEVFAHDPETLRYFFHDDARTGVPMLSAMVLEGPVVPVGHPMEDEFKAMAAQALSDKAPQWDAETLSRKRCAISDLIDDLRDPRNAIEAAAIIGRLHEQLGDFYFRSLGVWSASGKHITRRLEKIDTVLSTRWEEAFLDAWSGQRSKLIHLTEEILRPQGGLLFDGYRLEAPPHWRICV